MAKDYYKILGVKKTDSKESIKKAYRDAVKRLHPDVKGKEFDKKRFYEVQEAYEILGDEEKRRMYDRDRERVSHQAREGWENEGFSPFGRMFREVFRVRETGWKARGGCPRPREAWTTYRATLSLTPEEASAGGLMTLRVPLNQPCPFCEGTGIFGLFACPICGGEGSISQAMPVEFSVPPGVEEGTVLRVPFTDAEGMTCLLLLTVEIDWLA